MMKRHNHNNKGQALLEFALVIPLLLVLLLGIVEFGRILGAELTVVYSAREGARTGVTGGDDLAIIAQVSNSASALDAEKLTIVVNPLDDIRTRGQQLSVSVSYPITIIFPFISNIVGETVTVNSICTMRVE